MSQGVKQRRRYSSVVRAEQAGRTRERIVAAATERFLANGYERTTVTSIAEAAEVAPETIYGIYGTKRAVLDAVIKDALRGGDEPSDVLDRHWVKALSTNPDVRERMRGFARHTAQTLSRMSPIQALIRAAAASDPDLAALLARLHHERFARQRRIMHRLADNSGIDVDHAAATFSAVTSPELHYVLTGIRGWSHQRYTRWLEATAVAALIKQR